VKDIQNRGDTGGSVRIEAQRHDGGSAHAADTQSDISGDYASDSSFSWARDESPGGSGDEAGSDDDTVPVRALALVDDEPGGPDEKDNGFDPYDTGRLFANRS